MSGDPTERLARAFPGPRPPAVLRAVPEDFRVEEVLGYEPAGTGDHAWLRLEKTGANTDWVAAELARFAGVRRVDVGYAGLKDRQAVAVQWFSVDLSGRPEPAWDAWQCQGVRVLAVTRHPRKLRRGGLAANRFRLVLRGVGTAQRRFLEASLACLAAEGAPNYYGPQRFGREGRNLDGAAALFAGRPPRGRHLRGLYISAARAFLFNEVLAARVADGSWRYAVPGEALLAAEGARGFLHHRAREARDETLERALAEHRLHPSGPLWGAGPRVCAGYARALEDAQLGPWSALRAGLETIGLRQERRALRLTVAEPSLTLDGDHATLAFRLPRGTYATSVVRELVSSPRC